MRKMVLQRRQEASQKQGIGMKPSLIRRSELQDFRLPIVVKWHKPVGMTCRDRRDRQQFRDGVEDLRLVRVLGRDKFELDLYDLVGELPDEYGGLMLWSRDKEVTKSLLDPQKGVLIKVEAEVLGVVDPERLQRRLSKGVETGPVGFRVVRHAGLVECALVPGCGLQDPRTRVVIATRDPECRVDELLRRCGLPVDSKSPKVQVLSIGPLDLGTLPAGGLVAASDEEDAWACQLAGLAVREYPLRLRPPEPILEKVSEPQLVQLKWVLNRWVHKGPTTKSEWDAYRRTVEPPKMRGVHPRNREQLLEEGGGPDPAEIRRKFLTTFVPAEVLTEAVQCCLDAVPGMAEVWAEFAGAVEEEGGDAWAQPEALVRFLCFARRRAPEEVAEGVRHAALCLSERGEAAADSLQPRAALSQAAASQAMAS
ncbi:unnamed protein product [Prorocentrum cordatum]|nr:unnamed protein product [Polarella glacialis]